MNNKQLTVLSLLIATLTILGIIAQKKFKALEKTAAELEKEIGFHRLAFQALSRTNWYYIGTDTNNMAEVSSEPNEKGEKMKFPLPGGYHSWAHAPIPVEKTIPEGRFSLAVEVDRLKGNVVHFFVNNKGDDLRSTLNGLLVADFVYPNGGNRESR